MQFSSGFKGIHEKDLRVYHLVNQYFVSWLNHTVNVEC